MPIFMAVVPKLIMRRLITILAREPLEECLRLCTSSVTCSDMVITLKKMRTWQECNALFCSEKSG